MSYSGWSTNDGPHCSAMAQKSKLLGSDATVIILNILLSDKLIRLQQKGITNWQIPTIFLKINELRPNFSFAFVLLSVYLSMTSNAEKRFLE